MKLFVIKSTYSPVPLAEFRTDGTNVSFIVDNTNGNLTRLSGGNYERLVSLIRNSSHLSLEDSQGATTSFLRYVMDNGDVVEITTDGHTAMINGRIINEQEKQALFAAIRGGQLKVSRKADTASPIPVLPSPQQQPQQPQPKMLGSLRPEEREAVNKRNQERQRQKQLNGPNYDFDIETGDYRGSEDPQYVKEMLYYLKYGDKNGR